MKTYSILLGALFLAFIVAVFILRNPRCQKTPTGIHVISTVPIKRAFSDASVIKFERVPYWLRWTEEDPFSYMRSVTFSPDSKMFTVVDCLNKYHYYEIDDGIIIKKPAPGWLYEPKQEANPSNIPQ